MADKIKVWFDAEADFLEVRFSDAAGYEKETQHDAVMERVDAQGRVIGFSVMGVSQVQKGQAAGSRPHPGLKYSTIRLVSLWPRGGGSPGVGGREKARMRASQRNQLSSLSAKLPPRSAFIAPLWHPGCRASAKRPTKFNKI